MLRGCSSLEAINLQLFDILEFFKNSINHKLRNRGYCIEIDSYNKKCVFGKKSPKIISILKFSCTLIFEFNYQFNQSLILENIEKMYFLRFQSRTFIFTFIFYIREGKIRESPPWSYNYISENNLNFDKFSCTHIFE